MTRPSIYVETSIVSYLAARPSRDLIIAAQQAIPRELWRDAPERFVLVASEPVLTEAADVLGTQGNVAQSTPFRHSRGSAVERVPPTSALEAQRGSGSGSTRTR